MSEAVHDLILRLRDAGHTCESISRSVSLPVRDVARVVLGG